MMAARWLALVAANEGLREWQTQLLKASPILAGLLLALALVFAWLKKCRKAQEDHLSSPSEQLAYFQKLHWDGELSKEEFERVQARLGERIRLEETQAQSPPSSPSPERPPPPEPPESGIQPQPPG
jgi:hypothetical protein